MRIEEVQLRPGSELVDSSLSSMDVRNRFKVQVLALRLENSEHFDYTPDAQEPVPQNATLIVLGDAKDVAELRRCCSEG